MLGWSNIIIILAMGLLFPIKQLALTRQFRSKIVPIYRKMRIIHPWLGIAAICIGLTHGSMALGGLAMHTGLLLVMTLVLTGLIALAGPNIPFLKYRWRDIHIIISLLVVIALLIHMFWRGLI